MPRSKPKERTDLQNTKPTRRYMRPALTPEADEQQMIALATDLARKQLLDGTASSQVITHYLSLASSKKRLEMEKMKLENDLLVAKTEALRSNENIERLYKEAIDAMAVYSGHKESSDYTERH